MATGQKPSSKDTPRCCRLSPDHPLWRQVMVADAEWSAGSRDRAIEQALAEHGHPLTLDEVRLHMHRHHPEQPEAPTRVFQRAARVAETIGARDRLILEQVAQMGKVGAQQTADIFGCRRDSVARTLDRLWHQGYLVKVNISYRVGHTTPRAAYLLTPLGKACVEELMTPDDFAARISPVYTRATRRPDAVKRAAILHDLQLGEILGALYADAALRPYRKLPRSEGAPAPTDPSAGHDSDSDAEDLATEDAHDVVLSVERANLHGANQLYMGHAVPGYQYRGVTLGGQRTTLAPDGFTALGLRNGLTGLDVSLPLFVEFDSGTLNACDAGRGNLWEYAPLALSGAPIERFPDYADAARAVGFKVPVLWVTQHGKARGTRGGQDLDRAPTEANDRRIQTIIREHKNKHDGVRWHQPQLNATSPAPMFVVSHPEIRAHGWSTPVCCLHLNGAKLPLWIAMLQAATPALSHISLRAGKVVELNLQGATAYLGAASSKLTVTEQRERETRGHDVDRELDELNRGEQAWRRERELSRGEIR